MTALPYHHDDQQPAHRTVPDSKALAFGYRDSSAYPESKARRVREGLARMGFQSLPPLMIDPAARGAEPLAVVTGASFSRFDPAKHVETATKCFYRPLGRTFLCNTAAAVATELLDQNRRVLVHCSEKDLPLTQALFERHPNAERLTVVAGDLGSAQLVHDFYRAAITSAASAPVSRIDLVLYESYAAGLERPFVPMFEDCPRSAGAVTARRIETFHNLFMTGYDLLLCREQQELRVVALTALAARRASANLCTDTLHKVTSSALLETYAYEAGYFTERPVCVVEIAPGMVDTGIYDRREVREAVYEEAIIDGFPFDDRVSPADPFSWPMIHVGDLAKLTRFYLESSESAPVDPALEEELRPLTTAGRTAAEFKLGVKAAEGEFSENGALRKPRSLPSFAYVPDTCWNGLPPLRRGYTPVMLSPRGQYF